MRIKKFEDLESWKKARQLTKKIYEATAEGSFTRDFGLKDQIRRASISILSNIAEGSSEGETRSSYNFSPLPKAPVARFAHNSTLLWIKDTCRKIRLRDCSIVQMKLAG